ncbi:helix-turn-helix transcriptional regulator [Kitasatospora sp. NPDC048722]|uniref:helix-turn-helix domain-containing protein n=1 Tax=Kitasatospora sp. NPDC048722 TaxID=3155639 RepID=UPI0033C5F3E5
MTTEELFSATVSALRSVTGESQARIGEALGLTPSAVSYKLRGRAGWSLGDVEALSRHFGIPVPDLMAGPTWALEKLPKARRMACVGGRQEVIPV